MNMNLLRSAMILSMCLAALAGCEPPANVVGAAPPRPVTDVQNVILEVRPPVALNWDGRPGPDGFQVRVFFFATGDLPVTVSGTLEAQLFESEPGKNEGAVLEGKPFKAWTYAPSDLNASLARTRYGWGYGLVLAWGEQAPKTQKVILRVRYRSPSGQTVFSDPVTLQMSLNSSA